MRPISVKPVVRRSHASEILLWLAILSNARPMRRPELVSRPPVWEILVILAVFIAFAAVSERLRLGTVLGFLVGGAVIGPSGLGVVRELEAARELADLGVVFLLFNLGLELKIERLRLIGTRVYVLGMSQLLVTAGAIGWIAYALGLGIEGGIVVGGALAVSSTAVVLRVLRDLGRTLTQLGRVAIAILLVQDIAVGPLLVLTKALGPAAGSLLQGLLLALGKGVLILLTVALLARFALRPVLAFLAALDADEVFTAMTLLLVLGASFATEQAGLSTALGAFVAGLMVADTEYRHQVAADIGRFRGLLLGFFFMTVGMTLDVGFALRHIGTVVAIAVGLLLLKALLLGGLAVALGFGRKLAVELAALLAQGSEFAFVLLALAMDSRVLAGETAQAITVAIALSMAVTAVAATLARGVLNRVEGEASASLQELAAETEAARNHIVVVGFGQVGMALTRHLVGLQMPVLALDYDPRRVRASRERHLPVYFGNAARADVLRAAHVGQARLVVVALPSTQTAERVVALLRGMFPRLRVLARVPDEDSVTRLRDAGADAVVVDGLTTALDLAQRAVLLYEPEESRPATGA
jgi:monovalent cation:proton antiporter-2 (CPA2) family protein